MISDEMLRIAASEFEQALLSTLPKATQCTHTFSPKFEAKMRFLCHKTKYASAYSVLQRIAYAVIAIILCGSMLLMLNTDVRAAVIGWVKDTYKSFNRYFFINEESQDATYQSFDFAQIPDGYILLDRMETDSGTAILYLSPDGSFLDLSYQFGLEADTFFFKAEDHTYTQENIDGQVMDIYISNNPQYTNAIIWCINNEVLFKISANCNKDTLIELAKNVVPTS